MKYRPLDLRLELYRKVYEFRNSGLSYKQIIEKIEEKYGERLSKSHISYWIRELHGPHKNVLITLDDVKPSKELAYIIGVIAGDGWIHVKGDYCYRIGLKCRDVELAVEFSRCLEYVTGSKPQFKIRRDGFYVVEGYSKTLYELLKKPLNIKKLRQYIEYSEETITAFLRGFFDSEGCVDKNGQIDVYNADLRLLNYVKELLLKLKIEVTGPHLATKKTTPIYDKKKGKTYYRNKDVYNLYIRANSRRRFTELIGFTIKRKMDRLMKSPQPPIFFSH